MRQGVESEVISYFSSTIIPRCFPTAAASAPMRGAEWGVAGAWSDLGVAQEFSDHGTPPRERAKGARRRRLFAGRGGARP